MNEDLVTEIMAAEAKATQIRNEAERRADKLVSEARDAAEALRNAVRSQAQEQADEIKERGQEAAKAERARLVSEAQSQAEDFRSEARKHFEPAVTYVVQQILRPS